MNIDINGNPSGGDMNIGSSGSHNVYFMHTDTFQMKVSGLLGKVLTIVDATYPNEDQRESVKQLVKDAFSGYRDNNWWDGITTTTINNLGDSGTFTTDAGDSFTVSSNTDGSE